jgi:hypothetical protein
LDCIGTRICPICLSSQAMPSYGHTTKGINLAVRLMRAARGMRSAA